MKRPRLRLRLRHLLGLVAASAAFFAVMQYRGGVYDPASAQARRLRSIDPDARLAAVGELASLGREAEAQIPSLLGALNDGDPRVRARAAMAMTGIIRQDADHPRAGDIRAALTAALGDPDSGARHAAAVALGMLLADPKTIISALIEAAGDDDPGIRSRAVGELGGSDDESARAVIAAAIRDREPGIRAQAIRSIAWHPTPAQFAAVRAAVLPALKDENGIVRGTAVETLGRYGAATSADVPELYAALADPDPYVRRMACTFLIDGPGSRPVLPALIRALSDPAVEVRHASAGRLGAIGLDAEEALPDLRRAAEDKEGMVRTAASESVRRIEAKLGDFRTKLLPGALADLASPDPDVRRGAAEALGLFGPRSAPAVPALIRCLDDREAAVRLASARTLGRIGPSARDATPALVRRATDPDEHVRRASAMALGAIRGEAGGR